MCEVMYTTASWAASSSRDGLEERPSSSIMTGTGMTTVHRRLSTMDAMADREDNTTLVFQNKNRIASHDVQRLETFFRARGGRDRCLDTWAGAR